MNKVREKQKRIPQGMRLHGMHGSFSYAGIIQIRFKGSVLSHDGTPERRSAFIYFSLLSARSLLAVYCECYHIGRRTIVVTCRRPHSGDGSNFQPKSAS